MPVVQAGSINTNSLWVPDLYVQIQPPQVNFINGLPTNILGCVGTASWGPVNAPTIVSGNRDYAAQFGPIQARKYDLGTFVAAASFQGANNFRCVRVTDGTDVAASVTLKDNATTPLTEIIFTGKYTGSYGNNIQVTIATGSAANTSKVTVAMPGVTPEVFDNITGTGATLYVNMANAINNGTSLRGPSALITASAGTSAVAPTLATSTLAGGTDGASTITGATLVGVDTSPRKGMYALRGTGASIAALVDCDDTTQFSAQVAYGLAEGTYMIGTTPQGDTISNAVSAKATAGIDSYAFKYMLGDWIYFNDPVNGGQRLVSPQGYVAGRLANLSPEQSSLNKPLQGIVGTQSTATGHVYSEAELTQLAQAGIDVITNPIPAGNSFGVRIGHNSSSNAMINGDNYTRMTNYIAYTLNAGMGTYIGKPQTATLRRQAKSTIDSFLANLEQQNMIGAVNGGPAFQTVLDASNNPMSRVALGYMQADVAVTYLSITEKFLINMQGGQSVQVTRAGAVAA